MSQLSPSVLLVQGFPTWKRRTRWCISTVDYLSSPQLTSLSQEITPVSPYFSLTFTNLNIRNVAPSGRYNQAVQQASNPTLVDPGMLSRGELRSDLWNFPTNKFPSIGWLGRVHRGTPWQTVFLKADGNPLQNYNTWITKWVTNSDSYPTNDYALLNLFTAAPNDNAVSGQLSINQTNEAAWSAVLSGVIAFTNSTAGIGGIPIDPTNVPYFLGEITGVTNGIDQARASQRNGIFHHLGDILSAPTLTIQSPYLNAAAASTLSDDVVERIPEQILGLLKVGQPQFVIYAWGQALRPKDLYLGGGPNFNLCTNYQITSEFLTRTVCHVVGDPFGVNPRIQIDSKNIEPSN